MEACYARCNCWTDFPDMGGQVTHEVDALCMMDACWCSYNQDLCPYGTLKTNPYCCTKVGITCDDIVCDTEGECHEVDALCMMDACWCSYNQDLCPYGTLKT